MATAKNTPKTPAPRGAKKNTSAPVAADVSATGGTQVPPQAAASSAAPTVSSELQSPPPGAGEAGHAELVIVSRREGFRRAGRAWSVAPTTVPAGELTAEQFAALIAEPMLTVTITGATD